MQEIQKPKLEQCDTLFKELYGYLQALRLLDDTGEEIFDLDYSLLKETK